MHKKCLCNCGCELPELYTSHHKDNLFHSSLNDSFVVPCLPTVHFATTVETIQDYMTYTHCIFSGMFSWVYSNISAVTKSILWHMDFFTVHLQCKKRKKKKNNPIFLKSPTCKAQAFLISCTCSVLQLNLSKLFPLVSFSVTSSTVSAHHQGSEQAKGP